MGARLYIAEKPSVAREIARVLGVRGRGDGYIECAGENAVTWCFGHLLEHCEPEAYLNRADPAPGEKGGKARWRLDDLPIIPAEWRKEPRDASCGKQIGIIRKLAAQATEIVHAGDADREGQLLVDEVIEHIKARKQRILRLWLQALDDQNLKRALNSLKANGDYAALRDAAEARSRADWLIGMNLTRALTVRARDEGLYRGLLSVGRVQTPTLALVVRRDEEIENFVPHDYYQVWADLNHANGRLRAYWQPPEDSGWLDEDGRLVNQKAARDMAARAQGQTGKVLSFETRETTRQPPLPYSLSALQKAAGRFGLTAKQTLEAAQSLYEKKVATYPRSDCRHLPEEQFADAPALLRKLAGVGFDAAGGANPKLKSPAWNSRKVAESSHHAIIPTGERAELSDVERKVFDLIVAAYIRQFYPPEKALAQTALVDLAGGRWKATGRKVLEPGWTRMGDDDKQREEGVLPTMTPGDSVKCTGSGADTKRTEPARRFTDATLIEAMTGIHRYVSNPEIKKKLRETSGIGTEATRAAIIETLIDHKYLERRSEHRQKCLISTPIARALIHSIPKDLADPGVTALWEDGLCAIAAGRFDLKRFVEAQSRMLKVVLSQCLKGDLSPLRGAATRDGGARSGGQAAQGRCPVAGCGADSRSFEGKNGKTWWKCENEHVCFDDAGKPGRQVRKEGEESPKSGIPCPRCGAADLARIYSPRKQAYFWKCSGKRAHWFDDRDGRPMPRTETRAEMPCPACGDRALVRLALKAGGFFFKCELCQAAFSDESGAPGRRWGERGANGSPSSARQARAHAESDYSGPPCPECNEPLRSFTARSGRELFACRNEEHGVYFNNNGQVGRKIEKRAA